MCNAPKWEILSVLVIKGGDVTGEGKPILSAPGIGAPSPSRYRSAIHLFEYKIMQIGQFWRLLNCMRFLIMRFYCQKDSLYDTESMKGARQRKKQHAHFGPRTAHYRSRHKFVGR